MPKKDKTQRVEDLIRPPRSIALLNHNMPKLQASSAKYPQRSNHKTSTTHESLKRLVHNVPPQNYKVKPQPASHTNHNLVTTVPTPGHTSNDSNLDHES
ncbi:hypothetical protein Taro_014162 [Colocasia esculenta]|uniref:Uncharacterized protein n=1 Tax=Colocasia esculenta TaxID=4460 RepID=A0A843UDS0_COLES|nr:hypothetical protein [Colocasia esculenta]